MKSWSHQTVKLSNNLEFSFSDIVLKYGTQNRKAHKFVLAARSSVWLDLDLSNMEELEMNGNRKSCF